MRRLRATGIGLLVAAHVGGVHAQSVSQVIASNHISAGYAQLLNLAATPDISSAYYKVSDDGAPTLNILRIPYESKWFSLSNSSDLYWRVSAGYLTYKAGLPIDLDATRSGDIAYKSSAFSGTGGIVSRTRLGGGFTIEPALDFGVARMLNDSSYSGALVPYGPKLDGTVANWHTDAWLVTPNLGLDWTHESDERRISVSGHIAWSWISSFSESADFARFHEKAGAYSIHAELSQPIGLNLLGRPLNWVARGGYGGFYGGNRDALGFTSVADVGLGLETPLQKDNPQSRRITGSVGYLFGPGIWGWSANLGLRY